MEEHSIIPINRRKNGVGAHKSCCYGFCKNGNRSRAFNSEFCNFYFIPFPKPCREFRNGQIDEKIVNFHYKTCEACWKCHKWVKLCGRRDSQFRSIRNVTKDIYICSLHFVGESGPTKQNPDPIKYMPENIMKEVRRTRRSLEEKYQGFTLEPKECTPFTKSSPCTQKEKSRKTNKVRNKQRKLTKLTDVEFIDVEAFCEPEQPVCVEMQNTKMDYETNGTGYLSVPACLQTDEKTSVKCKSEESEANDTQESINPLPCKSFHLFPKKFPCFGTKSLSQNLIPYYAPSNGALERKMIAQKNTIQKYQMTGLLR